MNKQIPNRSYPTPKNRRLSPGRMQYMRTKALYPDTILLFRIGDFYETFEEDAKVMAKELGIALTTRDIGGGQRVPLAGIPYHALDNYLPKLIKAGLKVAIAEQTTHSTEGSKALVQRKVVRVVTPGTVIEPSMLDSGISNFLAVAVVEGNITGFSYVDLTTSEFVTSQIDSQELHNELTRVSPSEILVNSQAMQMLEHNKQSHASPWLLTPIKSDKIIDTSQAEEVLKAHFNTVTLDAFGCQDKPYATVAAGYILNYLYDTQMGVLPQIVSLRTDTVSYRMLLDTKTIRDLELVPDTNRVTDKVSILSVLGRPKTPMGKRLLRSWVVSPLVIREDILARQDNISMFCDNPQILQELLILIARFDDLERLINKVKTLTATPRDLLSIANGLQELPNILKVMSKLPEPVKFDKGKIVDVPEPCRLINSAIKDDASTIVGKGETIKSGFNNELDMLRNSSNNSRAEIIAIETQSREKTGIKTLKVGYSRVFGYYIEVSKSNINKVPKEFERRQTVANGERYTMPILKELETRILKAGEQINYCEKAVFEKICKNISAYSELILNVASGIARLDVFTTLAMTAGNNGWIKPEITEKPILSITKGKHPLVEATLGPGRCVPNKVEMSLSDNRLMIITGPNMSGKSTYIKMVATLTLMAQIGSFIPAEKACIGIADRIFTRAGLSDDIAGGMSTFMVEMLETASILNQSTYRSLVVFDEIGRGTSTYDGLAIAQAVSEYIHNSAHLGCRTLFATHFHELTAVGNNLSRAGNFQVAVTEKSGQVFFRYHILQGGADRSYGVHVAQIAGIPKPVVERAKELLQNLENKQLSNGIDTVNTTLQVYNKQYTQSSMLPLNNSQVICKIKDLDIGNITPIKALNILMELQELVNADN